MKRPTTLVTLCFVLAAMCLLLGTYMGLFVAPAEEHMGEVPSVKVETVAIGTTDVVLTLK